MISEAYVQEGLSTLLVMYAPIFYTACGELHHCQGKTRITQPQQHRLIMLHQRAATIVTAALTVHVCCFADIGSSQQRRSNGQMEQITLEDNTQSHGPLDTGRNQRVTRSVMHNRKRIQPLDKLHGNESEGPCFFNVWVI